MSHFLYRRPVGGLKGAKTEGEEVGQSKMQETRSEVVAKHTYLFIAISAITLVVPIGDRIWTKDTLSERIL